MAQSNSAEYESKAGSQIVRSGLGQEVERQHETASTALAAASRAAIEAAFVMALRRPRNWADVRSKLLLECDRPGFARAARYIKPVGRRKNEQTGEWEQAYVEGLSIRFAEAAVRYMTNVHTHLATLYDDEAKQIVNVTVRDLEANVTYSADITVAKTVERRQLKKGQIPIRSRINSYGDQVFIVEATDDEVLNHVNALASKALRNNVLRVLPGDIQEECEDRCARVAANADAVDPTAARNQLLDAFAKLGVMPSDVQEYLGHDPSVLQPVELTRLRAIYAAIRDQETTWHEIMDARDAPKDGDPAAATEKGGVSASRMSSAVDDLVKKHEARAAERKKAKSDPNATTKSEEQKS